MWSRLGKYFSKDSKKDVYAYCDNCGTEIFRGQRHYAIVHQIKSVDKETTIHKSNTETRFCTGCSRQLLNAMLSQKGTEENPIRYWM